MLDGLVDSVSERCGGCCCLDRCVDASCVVVVRCTVDGIGCDESMLSEECVSGHGVSL